MNSTNNRMRSVNSKRHCLSCLREYVFAACFLFTASFCLGMNASRDIIHAALIWPPDGSAWAPGATIPLVADAWTTEGTILRVEFLGNGSIIHTAFAAPYEFHWTCVAQGRHEIIAQVFSSSGDSAETLASRITVGYPPRKCLFLVGGTALPAGDQAIAEGIERLGYQVAAKAAAASQSSDANGMDLIFISESVSSNHIGAKFRDVMVPVLCAEDYNYDDMNMTGPTIDTHYGFLWDQPVIDIAAGASPLSGGLAPGPVTVYSATGRTQWGIPTSTATIGAYVHQDPSRPVLFGYRGGAEMYGGFVAPARRTGFFMQSYTQEMTLLTPAGLILFDAGVRWTGGADTYGPPPRPEQFRARSDANSLALSWIDKADNEEGFELETSADGSIFEFFMLLPPDVAEVFLEAPSNPAIAVYYRIRAWNGEGVSGWSEILRVPEEVPASGGWISF